MGWEKGHVCTTYSFADHSFLVTTKASQVGRRPVSRCGPNKSVMVWDFVLSVVVECCATEGCRL